VDYYKFFLHLIEFVNITVKELFCFIFSEVIVNIRTGEDFANSQWRC